MSTGDLKLLWIKETIKQTHGLHLYKSYPNNGNVTLGYLQRMKAPKHFVNT